MQEQHDQNQTDQTSFLHPESEDDVKSFSDSESDFLIEVEDSHSHYNKQKEGESTRQTGSLEKKQSDSIDLKQMIEMMQSHAKRSATKNLSNKTPYMPPSIKIRDQAKISLEREKLQRIQKNYENIHSKYENKQNFLNHKTFREKTYTDNPLHHYRNNNFLNKSGEKVPQLHKFIPKKASQMIPQQNFVIKNQERYSRSPINQIQPYLIPYQASYMPQQFQTMHFQKGERNFIYEPEYLSYPNHQNTFSDSRFHQYPPHYQGIRPSTRQPLISQQVLMGYYCQQPIYIPQPCIVNPHSTSSNKLFCKQSFIFWKIKISIKLCSCLDEKGRVLLVTFTKDHNFQGVSEKVVNKMKYNMRQVLIKEAMKNIENKISDAYVFSVKARGLGENFRGIYFMKGPSEEANLEYYEKQILNIGLKNVFGLLNDHDEKSIIIPCFKWGNLSQAALTDLLINAIFRQISERKSRSQLGKLEKVVITVQNIEHYKLMVEKLEDFTKKMK